MTVGEAAKVLGISRDSVRRRVTSGELEGFWTDPLSQRTDVNGVPNRGHRRIYADSVERYRQAQSAAERKPEEHTP
jgi:Helix-turn-helix domain